MAIVPEPREQLADSNDEHLGAPGKRGGGASRAKSVRVRPVDCEAGIRADR